MHDSALRKVHDARPHARGQLADSYRDLEHVKERDDFRYSGGVSPQEWDDWLIPYPKGRLIDHYLSGHHCIALVRAEPHPTRQAVKDGFVIAAYPVGRDASASPRGDRCAFDYGIDDQEAMVLAHNVKAMEPIEHSVPSCVRAQRFDFGDFSLGHPLFAFDFPQIGQESTPQAMYGEVRCAVRLYAIALRERSGEQIEGASDRIQHGPHVCINQGVERLARIGDEELIAAMRIRLYDNAIRLSLLPSAEAFLQRWSIGYGPIY
jgi:hypothetical protein